MVMDGQVLNYEAKSLRNGAIEQGIKVLILDNLEDGKSEETIVNKLVRGFELETKEAKALEDG